MFQPIKTELAAMIRPLLLLLVLASAAPTAPAQSLPDFTKYPTYNGPDLGLTWRGTQATLRVWAPTAEALHLRLYAAGTGGAPVAEHLMRKAEGGTWTYALPAGTAGFYTVQATIGGRKMAEVADPYAHAVGLNGQRGAVLNPALVQPPAGPTTCARP